MSRRWTVLATLLLLLPACDDFAARDRSDGGDSADGGVGPPTDIDAGPLPMGADSGAGVDAGSAPGVDAGTGEGSPEYDTSLSGAGARASCFDGEDNDGDGATDCSDTSCQINVGSCCVGQSSAECCDPGVPESLPIDGCSGALAGCVDAALATTFGSPVPTVRTFDVNALVPGGQDTDSGALLLRELDPRAGTLTLVATIATPLSEPEADRVETVGVGFVSADTDPSSLSRVALAAGIVVSRNRSEVLLVLAGEVVQRWTLATEDPVTYTLEIDPEGRVRLNGGPTSADLPFPMTEPVRAIVYGRTANPTATTPPARVLSVTATPSVCDMPAALGRSGDTVVPAPLQDPSWADAHDTITAPHVLRYEDPPGVAQVRVVLEVDGEIHLARPALGGFVLTTEILDPALPPPTEDWAADGVSDPALVFESGQLELLFTGWADGLGTIARARWNSTTGRFDVVGPVPGLEATETIGYSAASPFELGGAPHLVARVDEADRHRIAIFRLGAPATEQATLRRPSGTDVFAFDRDEVGSPAVIVRDGIYRAYFAGRRGTRWSLGLLVSDDGITWHPPSPEAVLSPSGVGFDALGVRDPAFDEVGGEVLLYYTGDDGERLRIGVARAR